MRVQVVSIVERSYKGRDGSSRSMWVLLLMWSNPDGSSDAAELAVFDSPPSRPGVYDVQLGMSRGRDGRCALSVRSFEEV